jgi:RNA polymerase sigma-70 factor (ECF subfamily)
MAAKSEQAASFATTRWTVVLGAGQDSSPAATEALEELCRCYWYPLYAYVRRKGYEPETAEDLVQGFFERFLEKNYLGEVSRDKGKFRSFLLAAMNHFMANEADKERAQKRGGMIEFLRLEQGFPEERFARESTINESPEKAYERRWAITLLQEAMDRLEQEYAVDRKSPQFHRLKIFLTDRPDDGEYDRAGSDLKATRSAITSLVHRMRRRYRELVRFEVAQTVATPSEIEEEMQYLRRIFSS